MMKRDPAASWSEGPDSGPDGVAPEAFSRSLADYLRGYCEMLRATREVVAALERQSHEGLASCLARRDKVLSLIGTLRPPSPAYARRLRDALAPLLQEIRSLNTRAAVLLEQHRHRLATQAEALEAVFAEVPSGEIRRLPAETARYLDLAG